MSNHLLALTLPRGVGLRLFLLLACAIVVIAAAADAWRLRQERARVLAQLEREASLVTLAIQGQVGPLLRSADDGRLEGLPGRVGRARGDSQEVPEEPSPLAVKMDYIGKRLGTACLAVSGAVVALGIVRGAPPLTTRSSPIRRPVLVARSLHTLGYRYSRQGELAKAEPLYVRALAIPERSLGARVGSIRRRPKPDGVPPN